MVDTPKRGQKTTTTSSMSTRQTQCVGLWVDKSGATIVKLREGADPVIQRMESGVEGRYRLSGGRKSGMTTQDVSDEKSIERRHDQQLDRYYEGVATAIGGAENVLILGPGEAKLGLERTLKERRDRKSRQVSVKTADKMTERQLVAAAKRFFSGR